MPAQAHHLARELENLKKNLLHVGKLALSELSRAMEAYNTRDVEMARSVAASDKDLDAKEVRVEEECLRIIALHQPVAQDLRYLTSALKINQLIENTGDTAVNIAKRAEFLAKRPPLPIEIDITGTGARVVEMFDRALQSFVNLDELAAHEVIDMDSAVDTVYRSATQRLIGVMEQHSNQVEAALQTMNLMRHLERAADRATDIAEQVLYILTGDIVRHSDHSSD
ncbi:MAG: phosphate signaling complex protein PhoU [Planctomycetes bacterium]|nr:phosphate signaling complex protein PhoU [Planctomycetota bacterium]MCW8135679.1 phosphate signaling complex protein PhoU [Planctomycetota bacterium]